MTRVTRGSRIWDAPCSIRGAKDAPMDVTPVQSSNEERTGKLDAFAGHWRRAPHRWAHPLHSLCSYFAMFPPHIPRVRAEWLTDTGDARPLQ